MTGMRKLAASSIEWGVQPRAIQETAQPDGQESSSASVDGFRQGYRDGYEAGEIDARADVARSAAAELRKLEEARSAIDAEIETWRECTRHLVAEFEENHRHALVQVERLAAEVAVIVLTRMVGELYAHGDAVLAACRKTLTDLHLNSVRIHVHPDDAEGLADIQGVLEVVSDEALARGDCRVHGALGDINAGVFNQLDRLREALTHGRLDRPD
jgi:flagellar biosynthesis/type III secretory pathway protein FliH